MARITKLGAGDNWLEDSRREHFLKVLDQAHRQHLAFYTVDAAGLRAQSPSAAARQGALFSSTFGSEPYVALKMLADETGGRYVESTNDLTIGMRRVAEDLTHYYLLGYTSTNNARDGGVRSAGHPGIDGAGVPSALRKTARCRGSDAGRTRCGPSSGARLAVRRAGERGAIVWRSR